MRWSASMPLIAIIANALIDHAPVLALPRWRVMADIREKYRCSEVTAREAYALARIAGKMRHKRNTNTAVF